MQHSIHKKQSVLIEIGLAYQYFSADCALHPFQSLRNVYWRNVYISVV